MIKLKEIVHAHYPVITPNSSIREVIDKLDIYQFFALPILDEKKHPIGVVGEEEMIFWGKDFAYRKEFGETLLKDYQWKDILLLSSDLDIDHSLEKMIKEDERIAVVMDDNVMLGIVFKIDLLQALMIP